MKNSVQGYIVFCLLIYGIVVSVVSARKVSALETYSKAAYKDGFEAGSKTVTCEDSNESAFNDGVIDGLKRAKTMCGITIRREIK